MAYFCESINIKGFDFTVYADDSSIVSLSFKYSEKQTPNHLTSLALNQLKEFLERKRRSFDLPLMFNGTDFQKSVWLSLKKITFGEVVSYKEVAQLVGSPKAYRAVGMANNKNPLPIFIPCHRVIGTDRSLTGYAGGLELKKMLLKTEGVKL